MTTFTTEDRFAVLAEKAKEHLLSIEQGTDAWHQLRLGKVTASRMADVLSKGKSGESASRKNYRTELVVQRLTGLPGESFTNAAMEWGTKTEPQARVEYIMQTGRLVEQVAFMDHPTIKWFGCSPDGLVGEGLIEIKCPNSSTHIDYLMDDKPPSKYIPQMQCQMAVTGAKWADFCSFDPRLPEDLQLFVVRLERDEEYIKAMEVEVEKFLSEVEDTLTKLKARK
jgi:putative phage-type endonuclease